MREERTLQYLVIESSTARAALACVVPGAVMVKCKMAEARRRGVRVVSNFDGRFFTIDDGHT